MASNDRSWPTSEPGVALLCSAHHCSSEAVAFFSSELECKVADRPGLGRLIGLELQDPMAQVSDDWAPIVADLLEKQRAGEVLIQRQPSGSALRPTCRRRSQSRRRPSGKPDRVRRTSSKRRSWSLSGQCCDVAAHSATRLWGTQARPRADQSAPTPQAMSTPAGSASALIQAGAGARSSERPIVASHSDDGRPGIHTSTMPATRSVGCPSKRVRFSITFGQRTRLGQGVLLCGLPGGQQGNQVRQLRRQLQHIERTGLDVDRRSVTVGSGRG